jgi:ADP-ribose pyrophosphatase YjhB (NUDIX family)
MNKICRNCGTLGHVYKNCTKPITSYGIILVNNNIKRKYLLIQRKNSIAFSEFVFGKYSLNSLDYIKNMFNKMSSDELNIIKTKPNYNILWNKIYNLNNNYNKSIISKYYDFIKKYNNFLENFNLIQEQECEWEFPKGRRNNNESDLECACREFKEETNINISEIKITKNKFYEEFKSCNKHIYLHIYYLAFLKNNDLILDKQPCSEIFQIKWFEYDECLSKIRSYSEEKKKVLIDIEKILK